VGVLITRGSGKGEGFFRPNRDLPVIALQHNRDQSSRDDSEPTATVLLSGADALLMAA